MSGTDKVLFGETSLGGGIFASFDGNKIWLRTSRDGGDHYVHLGYDELDALVHFATHMEGIPVGKA